MRAAVLVLALIAGGVFVFWHLTDRDRLGDALLRPDDGALVAQGAAVYARECAACHGEQLEGQENWRQRRADGRLPAPPHDASGHTWHHPDQQLFALTKFGPAALVGEGYESDMPGYEEILSDEEIVAVLSYITSTWPPDVRETHDEINRRNRQSQ